MSYLKSRLDEFILVYDFCIYTEITVLVPNFNSSYRNYEKKYEETNQ